jgi:cell division protein FtsA
MHATGVGLVLKGFQQFEKHKAKQNTIKSHSKKIQGGFFEKIMAKSKEWFEESEEY